MSATLKRTFHYRFWLTKGQQRLLNEQIELCRQVYNETLAARKTAWEERQEPLGYYDTAPLLPQWKRERPDMKQVLSQVLQNVQVRVDLAFKVFFRRLNAGETLGYPRFKGRGRYDSITYPQYGNDVCVDGKTLTLSKISTVQFERHRPIEDTIKNVTLRRASTGKWSFSFSVEGGAVPLIRSLTQRWALVKSG